MKTIIVLLGTAITLLSTDASFARGSSAHYRSSAGKGPFICDNGRTYQIRGSTVYVDGLPARNYVDYGFYGAGDSYDLSVWENGFKVGSCRPATPPPAPAAPKRWDKYVKVCDSGSNCHWETREIQ